jgi:hypothetical protein
VNYEATPAELDKYGAGLNIWQQIALLQAWSPLIAYVQRWLAEPDPFKKSVIISEASEWLASKTKTTADDRIVRLLADAMKTPQGEALVRGVVELVEEIR